MTPEGSGLAAEPAGLETVARGSGVPFLALACF